MALVTCRRVNRYFAYGKGYACAAHAYRAAARKRLKDEIEADVYAGRSEFSGDWNGYYWFYTTSDLFGDGYTKRVGAFAKEFRKRYQARGSWRAAVNALAKELQAQDEKERTS